MRNIYVQNIAIFSVNSNQTKILQKIYNESTIDIEELYQQAEELGDEDIHEQVLFLADVLALPIFDEEIQTKDSYPQVFKTMFQKILAIPSRTVLGNSALDLLGHFAVAQKGQEMEYYTQFYKFISKFRLQNNYQLSLLKDQFQTAIAMQFFINQQYKFEQEHEPTSLLVKNYFKFKTTIIFHMLAFVNKDDYTSEEDIDKLRQMYQVQYEQATDEELN